MVTYELAVLGVLVAILVGGTTAAWLLARHDLASPAGTFGGFMLVMAYWSVTHLGTLTSETIQWQLAFTQLSYVGSTLAPVVWLVFALRYTGHEEWLSARRLGALSVLPVATLALLFTVQYHGLVYSDMWMAPAAGHPLLHVEYGPWFLLVVLSSYLLLLAGTGILFSAALSDSRLYRRQSAILVGAVTIPWLVNLSYNFGFRPIPWVDPTPVAFVATGIPLGLVVVKTDLASHLPVVHERVFRTLEDPILVVAPDGTVIDANRAARTILGDGRALEGRQAGTVLPDGVSAGDGVAASTKAPGQSTTVAIDRGGTVRSYVVRWGPVDPDSNGIARGTLVTLTDVTTQRRQRERLEEKTARLEAKTDQLERKNEQLERLADIVAHDLQTPLSTAEKLLTLLDRDLDDRGPLVDQSLADLEDVHRRLRGFADHLPRLARESTDVEATEVCDLATVATAAWAVVDTGKVALDTPSTRTVVADRSRLRQVFENLFVNAVEHGSTGPRSSSTREDAVEHGSASPPSLVPEDDVEDGDPAADGRSTASPDGGAEFDGDGRSDHPGCRRGGSVSTVRVGATEDGFFVADDGRGIPAELEPVVFEYGVSSDGGSGFGLAIVRTIVEAHGWEIEASESDAGGARFGVHTGTGPADPPAP